jgi:uncharacterized protein (DUF305 family)
VDPEVLDLARRIKDAQAPEIEEMTGWLEDWGADVPRDGASGMEGMIGMEGSDPMGGMMVEMELAGGESAEATQLAQAIVDTQQAEIDEMADLLEVR